MSNQHAGQRDSGRIYLRRRLQQPVYVELGSNNRGILMDLSETGLQFLGVGLVSQGQQIQTRFLLPGNGRRSIEAAAVVMWSNSAGRGGGLRFLKMSDEDRQRVKEWVYQEAAIIAKTLEKTIAVPSTLPVKQCEPATPKPVAASPATAPPAKSHETASSLDEISMPAPAPLLEESPRIHSPSAAPQNSQPRPQQVQQQPPFSPPPAIDTDASVAPWRPQTEKRPSSTRPAKTQTGAPLPRRVPASFHPTHAWAVLTARLSNWKPKTSNLWMIVSISSLAVLAVTSGVEYVAVHSEIASEKVSEKVAAQPSVQVSELTAAAEAANPHGSTPTVPEEKSDTLSESAAATATAAATPTTDQAVPPIRAKQPESAHPQISDSQGPATRRAITPTVADRQNTTIANSAAPPTEKPRPAPPTLSSQPAEPNVLAALSPTPPTPPPTPIPEPIQPAGILQPDFVLDRTVRGHSGWVTGVTFSPDGDRLASGSWDRTVKFWDVPTGRELDVVDDSKKKMKEVQAVALSRDGRWFAAENSNNAVTVWDARTGRELHELASDKRLGALGSNWVYSIAFSPDGQSLASAVDDKTVRLWDVANGRVLRDLTGRQRAVMYAAFSPDGRWLATGHDDKTIELWDLLPRDHVDKLLVGHQKSIYAVAFSPDGRWLASGSADKTIKIWDVNGGNEYRTLKGHSSQVTALAFSSDGRWLASGSWDKTIKIWDLQTGQAVRTLRGDDPVYSIAFDVSGKLLASGTRDGAINLWRLADAAR